MAQTTRRHGRMGVLLVLSLAAAACTGRGRPQQPDNSATALVSTVPLDTRTLRLGSRDGFLVPKGLDVVLLDHWLGFLVPSEFDLVDNSSSCLLYSNEDLSCHELPLGRASDADYVALLINANAELSSRLPGRQTTRPGPSELALINHAGRTAQLNSYLWTSPLPTAAIAVPHFEDGGHWITYEVRSETSDGPVFSICADQGSDECRARTADLEAEPCSEISPSTSSYVCRVEGGVSIMVYWGLLDIDQALAIQDSLD